MAARRILFAALALVLAMAGTASALVPRVLVAEDFGYIG